MDFITTTRNAPAAANYAANVGLVVKEGAAAGECVLAGAAVATSAGRPLGVIIAADNELGGKVTIVCHGHTFVKAGATLTPQTHTLLYSDANSQADPLTVPTTTGAAKWSFGWLDAERGTPAAAEDDFIRCFVQTQLIANYTEPL